MMNESVSVTRNRRIVGARITRYPERLYFGIGLSNQLYDILILFHSPLISHIYANMSTILSLLTNKRSVLSSCCTAEITLKDYVMRVT
jgi:hypothetical protein